MNYKPLFSSISTANYTGAFLLGAFVASFSSSIAVFYALIHKYQYEECKNTKSIYSTCSI